MIKAYNDGEMNKNTKSRMIIFNNLNCIGDILYEECRNRFGVVAEKQKGSKQKGRREREIEQLVKRRRKLRKQWRKASKEKKEGLKPLWEEVKKNLACLRRAERIRRRRGRGATSLKNPSSMRDNYWRIRETGSWTSHNHSWRVSSGSSTVTQRSQLRWVHQGMFLV